MNKITIQIWNEQQFEDSREGWTALLENSKSDQLFLSWEWQYTWWKVFAIPNQMQLRLYVAIDETSKLVGIAPLFISTIITAKYLKSRRLQFIGNCWRTRDTMRTELLDFIVAKDKSKEIIRALFEHIHASKEWDEFIIANINKQSETYQALIKAKCLPGCYLRTAEKYASYFLETKGGFTSYLDNLGKNTRLKLFNRRKLLAEHGEVTFQSKYECSIEENFKLLNKLHQMRWGYPAFSGQRLEFNTTLATLLSRKDKVRFSVLMINATPVSIQYNYSINHHVYNIQSGFNPDFHKKLALGYLHFGYEIEWAFNDGTTIYDFLAGEGKNTPYKEGLTKTSFEIVDLQIVRNKHLQLLYRIYDSIRNLK